MADHAREAGVESVSEIVCHGTVGDEILAAVDERDDDVVVLRASDRGGVDRVLLESVSERVVRAADGPVVD